MHQQMLLEQCDVFLFCPSSDFLSLSLSLMCFLLLCCSLSICSFSGISIVFDAEGVTSELDDQMLLGVLTPISKVLIYTEEGTFREGILQSLSTLIQVNLKLHSKALLPLSEQTLVILINKCTLKPI